MPFAKDAGGVARSLEHLRQSEGLQNHPLALTNGVGDSVLELMPSTHPSKRVSVDDLLRSHF